MRGLKKTRRLGSRPSLKEKGQISIFIGSMMLTFFLFLAFVLNTGMIVNAKINLQNAADLAAYAGAAVQARQLNDIGYLNYEMRRVFKKFLFRYYVIGNATQPTFPKTGGSGPLAFGVTEFTPGGGGGIKQLGVPSTCVTFLPNDNYCAIANLPSIPSPAGGVINALDAIMGALSTQLDGIEAIRKKGCLGIGRMNQMLMLYWLWNTDPSLNAVVAALSASGGSPEDTARLSVLKSLAAGLGLIPREIFLRKRIDTLNRYVNYKPQKQVDINKANSLKSGADWAMHERTVQAYLSAFHTLGEHTFDDPSSILMDEILPEGSDGANLLSLQNVETEFDAFATDFAIGDGNACDAYSVKTDITEAEATAARDKGCSQCLVSYSQSKQTNGFKPVIGVAKDPKVMTYYAIRLQAKAKLLFSPYPQDLTLTAYAAAQPFGSRIGPSLAESVYAAPGAPAPGFPNKCNFLSCVGSLPNLPVKAGDPAASTLATGWAQKDVVSNFYRNGLGITPGTIAVQQNVTSIDLLRAYHVAMAPNPWELGKYLIPSDSNDDPFLQNFDGKGVRAIWAPLFSGSADASNANPAAEIVGYINQMATAFSTQTQSAQSIFSGAAQTALINQINSYVNGAMKNGQGEDGEGWNVVKIYDPLKTRPDLSGTYVPLAPAVPAEIHMRDAASLKTGWNDVLASQYKSKGRVGYSVKYVPLNTLRSASGVTTNGSDSFSNTLPTSDGVGNDITEMKH